MIPVEHIGAPGRAKRFRAWLHDLFGSAYVAHLERELLQAKVERDRVISELRAENRELLNRLLASRQFVPLPSATGTTPKSARGLAEPTRWEQLQAKAIAENAKAEAEEQAAQPKPQEN